MKRGLLFMILALSSFTTAFSQEAKIRVGVLDFNARSIAEADALAVSDLFRGELVASGKFDVIDRNNMNQILSEQEFQQSGCTDSSCAVEIGRMLNMQYMIYGSVLKLGDALFIQVEMVNIETAGIEKSVKEKFSSISEADIALKRIIGKLTGEIVESDESQIAEYSSSSTANENEGKNKKAAAFISLGVGTFSLGAVSFGMSFVSFKVADRIYRQRYLPATNTTDAENAYDRYSKINRLGNVLRISSYGLMGIGVPFLIVGIVFKAKGKSKAANALNFIPTPSKRYAYFQNKLYEDGLNLTWTFNY